MRVTGWLAAIVGSLFVLVCCPLLQGAPAGLPYPGGHTFLRYEFRSPGEPPATVVFEVIPQGEMYEMKVSFSRLVPAQGFSLLEGAMGTPLQEASILGPLFALWDKELEPGREYLLGSRARLVTEGERGFLGIPVIVGTLRHPRYPRLRVVVYIPRLSHRALLPYPPYLRVEEETDGGFQLRFEIELVEFVHEG